ncbi:MAG: Phenylalanine-tRNA ligase beta subunit, partial [Parcubacteria group bacterium GW2011_GWC2_42_13]
TSKKNGFFEIPTIRRDLQIEEDLIEEVGRIYGYENIKAKHPLGELILPEENELLNFREKIRTYFAATGFSEVYNYSLSDQSELGFLPAGFQNVLLELKNPPKPESRFLRPSLLPRLFANASFNLRNFKNTRLPTRQVQIFEIGRRGKSRFLKSATFFILLTDKKKNWLLLLPAIRRTGRFWKSKALLPRFLNL